MKCSELKALYPAYEIVKNKIELSPGKNIDKILAALEQENKDKDLNTTDGLRVDSEEGWVHLRRSNTEPIIRVIAEGRTREVAEGMVEEITNFIQKLN